MKAPAFRYVKASSLPECFELMGRYGDDAKILAGGQSLIAALNMRLAAPAVLIDINGLEGLEGIDVSDGVVRIGALTRHRALEFSASIARHLPLLAQAVPHVAHPAIRNRGTFGGSIAFADPAAELPACSVALGATLVLASAKGERRIPAREFFMGLYETNLKPDELVVAVEFPIPAAVGHRSVFIELARRHGDYATAGIAAHATLDGQQLTNVSVVFFGVGATPVLATTVMSALDERSFAPALLDEVQTAVTRDVVPDGDLYHTATTKQHLSCVLARRAIYRLFGTSE